MAEITKPGVIVKKDIFAPKYTNAIIDRMFTKIWRTPSREFWITTRNTRRAVKCIKERAFRRSFGWTDLGRTPLQMADCIHFDDLKWRNQCGYVGDGDWSCDHPRNESNGEEGSCHRLECPIAHTVDDRDSLAGIGAGEDYDYDKEGVTDDSEWMRLHDRPRFAMPANLWVGFIADSQEMFEAKARIFRPLRFENPFLRIFCLAEFQGLNPRMKYWEDSERADWNPFEACEFSHGSQTEGVPYINRLITSLT